MIGHTVSDIQNIAETVPQRLGPHPGLGEHSQEISSIVAVTRKWPIRPTCWLSTPRSKRRVPASRAQLRGRRRRSAQAGGTHRILDDEDIDDGRLDADQRRRCGVDHQGVVATVEQGVSRAQEANAAIREIGEGSRNAVVMVEEITAAIREQGSATNSIANQVDRMAPWRGKQRGRRFNAEAAKQLDQLAADMQRIVSRYKLQARKPAELSGTARRKRGDSAPFF